MTDRITEKYEALSTCFPWSQQVTFIHFAVCFLRQGTRWMETRPRWPLSKNCPDTDLQGHG